MADLIAGMAGQTPLVQGLFLAIGGFTGVFVVIAVFFVSIIALAKLFKGKKQD
jgi:hypothetical protein